jgi:hypothetical protein
MILDKRIVWAFVLGCLFCYWINSGRGPAPSPFNPLPVVPQHDRPVLRLIAKAAKTALWFMLIAEPAPDADGRMVQHAVGADGFPTIDHARAF